MASTNKTTNYELSQYIGTDKPTYLVDYNGDMQKIDTGIKGAYDRGSAGVSAAATAQTAAETADGKATNAATAAASAQSAAETAATAAATADGKAVAAQTTANTANAATVVNANNITALSNFININTYMDLSVKTASGVTVNSSNLKLARNSDGSLCKIYGFLDLKCTASGNNTLVFTAQGGTGLAPDSDIYIQTAGVSTKNGALGYLGFTIKTNGDIDFSFYGINNDAWKVNYPPCIYFVKDFGDQPE